MTILGWLAVGALAILGLLVLLLALRIVLTRGAAPLELWHSFVPAEPDAETLERLDWAGYLAAEDQVLASVEQEIVDRLPAGDQPTDQPLPQRQRGPRAGFRAGLEPLVRPDAGWAAQGGGGAAARSDGFTL